MPGVKKDMCIGCGICLEECPVDAIVSGGDTYE